MVKNKKFFDFVQSGTEADITIFGSITSWEWMDSDMSSYKLSQLIQNLPDTVTNINVHINSYGGEVAEGLAIYNSLKNFKAKITTIVDGFACSAASIIFMAGNERIMNESSLLMIHNALMMTSGNSDQLRKDADDLDVMNDQIVKAYLGKVNILEDDVRRLMKDESWITPEDSVKWGFATSIEEDDDNENPENSAKKSIFNQLVHPAKEDVSVLNNGFKVDDDIVKTIIEQLKKSPAILTTADSCLVIDKKTADEHTVKIPVNEEPDDEGKKQTSMMDCFLYALQSISKEETEEK